MSNTIERSDGSSAVQEAPGHIRAVPSRPSASPIAFVSLSRHAPPTVCVVAEIGVNHDGRVDRAVELVEQAADIGADAVKVQIFDPKDLLSNQAMLAEYQKGKAEDVFTMLDRLKLDVDDLLAVRLAARRNGIGFIATPFSLENVTTLKHLDVDAVKIASPDAVNTPLLDEASSLGRPLFISTGTARLNELGYAAGLVRDRDPGGCMLQCVSAYPTPSDCASLAGLIAIADRFRLPVGYSDHTTDTLSGALAVAAGACVIEKHLTYDRSAPGPDHAASFDPPTFAEYTALIRRATAMLGPRHKQVHPVEEDVRTVARQSLCLQRDLPAGHALSREDLTIKRPGTAIPAAHLDVTIGRKLLRPVKGNDLLEESNLV